MRASIVIPSYNRCDRLRRVLEALAHQTVPATDFEVIVVSDGSTDGTDEFLHGHDLPRPVVAITQVNSGPGAARNRGVEAATAPVILFIDDDVIPAPDLVERHLAAQSELDDTVVIGPMLTPTDHAMSPWIDWEQRMLYKQYDDMQAGVYTATARQFYTGNASLPRQVFDASGGFDESYRRAEDVELAFRLDDAGVAFHFDPTARGFHYAERGFDSWSSIAFEYGRNDVLFALQPGRDWMPPFIAWAFRKHHLVVRIPTYVAIEVPPVGRALVATLQAIVRTEARLGRQIVSRPALSIIYSIRYHAGVAKQVGGPRAFRRLIRHQVIDRA